MDTKYSKEIGKVLAETLEELIIAESLQLDEIRDPAVLRAHMKRLEKSNHATRGTRLANLQRLHDRKSAMLDKQKETEKTVHSKMGGMARSFGYKKVKGQHGVFQHPEGHSLSIGPGNQWKHVKAGRTRAVHGMTIIRSLHQHLKKLHESTIQESIAVKLNERLGVVQTENGWMITKGGKMAIAGPFTSKYAATMGIQEVAPPGLEGTVKAMKKEKGISNPYALAWSMKNKGFKSHRKDDGTLKETDKKN